MKAFSSLVRAAIAAVMLAVVALPAATVLQLSMVSHAYAAVVSRIEVRGNQRVDDATIRDYVAIKPGVSFDNGDIDEAVKRLFSTGLFSDVRINRVGSSLVVIVEEYAIVNQVLFQGNKKLKDERLAIIVQLKPRGTFSQATLELDEQAIRDAYAAIGRNDAIVSAQVIDLGDNRVNVVFAITENGRTKIASINFVGNNAFSDRRLAGVISTKKSNLLSFIARDDVYDEDRLRADEETLRRFYYNRGYADFQVISSTAELNDSENEYIVTITVDEGDRYRFGSVQIESTVEGVGDESLRHLIETHEGDVYSAKNVEDTLIAITEHLSGMGYAFAQVTPRGNRDFETRTIAVVYSVDQGPRTYIQRIEIRGNTRTRDYVIRREFDISEGDAFNQVLVQRAKRRLEDLDYFTAVNISTVQGSQADQIVLVVDVIEKSTGEFSVGAGYSTGGDNPGPSIELGISERNFLGRGQYIKVSVGGGEDTRNYQLSFTEPYLFGRRIAGGFDIYRQTRDDSTYNTRLTGGSIRFGLPITEALKSQIAYNYSQESYIIVAAGAPSSIITAAAVSPWTKSSISGTLLYNTIDDVKNPREGIYATTTVEIAGLGGNAKFVKVTGRASYYHILSDEADIVGVISGGAGHVAYYGGGIQRPFDLFQGSTQMVRGFESAGWGPFDPGAALGIGDHLGGTTYFHGSIEAQFPLPVVPDSLGFKGAIFADAATLYGNSLAPTAPAPALLSTGSALRASVGASLIWNSPFGPLRVDYAIPIQKQPTDRLQEFNFGVSSRF
ncbi:MAG: outer membrane protein assembly factor BamA [Rhizobiaceae bacterium]